MWSGQGRPLRVVLEFFLNLGSMVILPSFLIPPIRQYKKNGENLMPLRGGDGGAFGPGGVQTFFLI